MFVFRPGTLEEAPQTFIAPLKGPNGPAARAKFQHDLVGRFPNVSVIDFHEILETIRDVMSKVTLAITVVGGLVLFSGVLILVGAVAMTKFQRVYEAAVFKTLGANTKTIATMLFVEYGVLGSLAGLVGSAGAVALTWGVSRYALDIPWKVFPWGTPRGRRVDGGARCGDWRAVEPRRAAEQAARDASSRVSGTSVLRSAVQAARLAAQECPAPMDVQTFKDALLKKRTEILGTGGIKPLQASMENNTRQGDMADQATAATTKSTSS